MTTFKRMLLTGAAGLALSAGLAVGSANAFDRSYWKFYLTIDPCIDIDVNLDPGSMTTVEADQLSVGDITAVSVVKDVYIDQPDTGHSHDWNPFHHNNNDGPDPLDALTELGSVVSAATAVANNVNVDTVTEATFADISQVAKGGWYSGGDVTAKSIVIDIDNLKVDSSATAVANNVNLAVDPGSIIAGTTVVANVSQQSFMDVTAKSIVKDVTLANFSGLGSLTTPVVNSVATAVGNNLNVSVAVPAP